MLLERLIAGLLPVAAGLHLAAAIGMAMNRFRAGNRLWITGWILSGCIVLLNGLLCREIPLGNMYHVLTLLPVVLYPLHRMAERMTGHRLSPIAMIVVAAVPLIGACFMNRHWLWQRPPVLQSAWFIPHVMAYVSAYALAGAAFGTWLSAVVQRLRGLDPTQLDKTATATLRLMFPFMTAGLCTGAIWADTAWGTFWSWDPKETWSLITWLLYAACLHAPSPPRGLAAGRRLHALAFGALLVTFLLVNLLPRLASPLHGYAATSPARVDARPPWCNNPPAHI